MRRYVPDRLRPRKGMTAAATKARRQAFIAIGICHRCQREPVRRYRHCLRCRIELAAKQGVRDRARARQEQG